MNTVKTNLHSKTMRSTAKLIVAFGLLFCTQTMAQDAAAGETLFKNNCSSCHAVSGERVIGPGLKGITARRDLAWIVKWVNNPQAVIASGDKYAVELYNKYNQAQMTAYPGLKEADISNIIAYIDASNAAPAAPVAGAVAAAPSGGGATDSAPSALFSYILVALMVVMLLVLGVLFAILTILAKAVTGEAAAASAANGISFMDTLRANLSKISQNPTIRTATVWLFILLAGKATLDGAFSIGISQGYAPKQPIAFSHKLHAGQYEINCNYCHTGVNRGKSAHIPSANICMNCHGAIKRESPEIQKIYASIENQQPIEWVRVHNLPDHAYFNHAQHVNVGAIECTQCHGEIEKMEVVQQRSTLTMGWCIDCHRKTEVNTKDNAYYDKLVSAHKLESKEPLKVANIGGLECSKCHY